MSRNERKPLLSDQGLSNGPEREVYYIEPEAIGKRMVRYLSASDVRDFYENLITTGKLRVVEEVELDEGGYCLRCGYDAMDRSDNLCPEFPPFCHGCGNKIKR